MQPSSGPSQDELGHSGGGVRHQWGNHLTGRKTQGPFPLPHLIGSRIPGRSQKTPNPSSPQNTDQSSNKLSMKCEKQFPLAIHMEMQFVSPRCFLKFILCPSHLDARGHPHLWTRQRPSDVRQNPEYNFIFCFIQTAPSPHFTV